MSKLAILEITDGTDTVNLLAGGEETGFHLEDWRPSIIQPKGGGVYQDSPIAPSRDLVFAVDATANETFDLKVNDYDQDALILQARKLMTLLIKARDYSLADWQSTPVYLVARSVWETNTRHALIKNFAINELANPYAAPFFSATQIVAMDEITLGLERDNWTANIPGTEVTVKISSRQEYDGRNLGRIATTKENEVFVASKHVVANLTDIYRDNGGVFSSNLMNAGLPFDLLPDPPAVNDAVYFGIDTSVADSGPFSSLVFDLRTGKNGNYFVSWEYSDGGAGWPGFSGNLFAQDDELGGTGIQTIQWIIPSDWAPETVNGVTAYWVRLHVDGFVSSVSVPEQQNRDIYSAILPYVDIDSDRVGGDIPALSRNRSSNPIGDPDTFPGVYMDRTIVGLRSMSRGSTFTAYLNISDEQEPDSAYSVVVGTNTSFANDISTPTGRRATFNPSAIEPFLARAKITITDLADFYGTFHVFLRARQIGGDIGDINVRVVIASNDVPQITGGSEPVLVGDGWRLVDLGILSITPRTLFLDTEDYFSPTVNIEADCTTASSIPDLYLSDLILIPVDEWAADAYQNEQGLDNGDVKRLGGRLGELDIDSVVFPKQDIRGLYRRSTFETSQVGNIMAIPVLISSGEAILQAGVAQRYWYLFAQWYQSRGTHTGANNASVLTDASADFINEGVKVGMIITNVTDLFSTGEITAVTATTITATLSGGTDDDWDTGDSYIIVTDTWISRHESMAAITISKNERYTMLRGAG